MQLLKTLLPIVVTENGNSICISEAHPINAKLPISLTDDGILNVTFFNAEQ